MRRVDFKPEQLTGEDAEWFGKWKVKAQGARNKAFEAIKKGDKPVFNGAIWTELKEFLLKKFFFGKCAYCESVVLDTSYGEAEHFRPKGKVTSCDGDDVKCGENPHPGYFWLAHDWRNLFPACARCNQEKKNKFPIRGKSHSCSEGDYDKMEQFEEPLLMNPYHDHPLEYFSFGLDGTIAARDGPNQGKAQQTIDVLKLARGDLNKVRGAAQEFAWLRFYGAMANETMSGSMDRYIRGEEPHSTACIEYVRIKMERIVKEFRSAQ